MSIMGYQSFVCVECYITCGSVRDKCYKMMIFILAQTGISKILNIFIQNIVSKVIKAAELLQQLFVVCLCYMSNKTLLI